MTAAKRSSVTTFCKTATASSSACIRPRRASNRNSSTPRTGKRIDAGRSFGCELKSGDGYPALCARAADLENPLPRLWRLEPGTCRPVPLVRRCRALPDLV